jgi:putative oxidoreductase
MARDVALLILRTAGLGLALAHGWGKVVMLASGGGDGFIRAVSAMGFPMPGVFAWAAALAEFAGGLAVALGLATRTAAGLAAFTMAVAAFGRHHAHDRLLALVGLGQASPEQIKEWGNPELALVYLAVLVALALLGGGRFSLDAGLGRKRR